MVAYETIAAPKTVDKLTAATAKKLYVALVRCRKFEEKIVELYPEQEMKCPTHLSIGQEGVAAGICAALRNEDLAYSTHRCHSHTIAKGGSFKLMMAELYGKSTGCSKGKGGSMHFVQPDVGLYGASAIVGGTIPVAVGAAVAAKMLKKGIVVVAFFGDGALEQGTFHESMNYATLHKLPIIFACENNFLATCTLLDARQPYSELYTRADGYHMPGVRVDGTKVEDVYQAAVAAVTRARKGDGPSFIEGVVYRWREHVGPKFDFSMGHRTKEELDDWMKKCPVVFFEEYLAKNNLLSKAEMQQISDQIQKEVNEAVVFAKQSPFPEPQELYQDV